MVDVRVGTLHMHWLYRYVWAVYSNGDRHLVDSVLNVTIESPSIEFAKIDGRMRVKVAEDAVASACGESLLRTGLIACGTEVASTNAPMSIDLPKPVSATFKMSADWPTDN